MKYLVMPIAQLTDARTVQRMTKPLISRKTSEQLNRRFAKPLGVAVVVLTYIAPLHLTAALLAVVVVLLPPAPKRHKKRAVKRH
jgi:hypothetical protein